MRGTVLVGSTCPGPARPGDSCGDRPIVATITFTMDSGAGLLYERTVTSEAQCHYSVDLAPGLFTVVTTSASAMSCGQPEVDVEASETSTLDITCDTGMR